MTRTFTPEQANEALAEVRPLVEELVRRRKRMLALERKRATLAQRIAGNGTGGRALGETFERFEREAAELQRALDALAELGVLVKDVDIGLVDFPAQRGDELVLLCWRLGEDEVAFWHGYEEGFAGRKPLPL